MALKSQRLYSQSDPLDLRLFVHRDAIAMGSVWTIDLAYLFKAFGVEDFTYYTTHIGINFNYAAKSYYKTAFATDSRRIHSLFADAHDCGVRVVPLLLPLADMKRFLMSGRYAVLMLVNLNAVRCRVCLRRERFAARQKQRRWRWLCCAKAQKSDSDTEAHALAFSAGQDAYLFASDNSSSAGSADENDPNFDSGVALPASLEPSPKQPKRTKRRQPQLPVPKDTQRSPIAQPYQQFNNQHSHQSSSYYDSRIATRQFTEQTPLLDHSSSPTQKHPLRQSIYQSTTSSAYAPSSVGSGGGLRRIRSNSSINTFSSRVSTDSTEAFSLFKAVASTVSWIGGVVFRTAADDDDNLSRSISSQTTTPLLSGHYEAALEQLPSSAFEISPPQMTFIHPSTPTSTSITIPSPSTKQKPYKYLPPGVGIVSTVPKDENCSLIYGNIPPPRSVAYPSDPLAPSPPATAAFSNPTSTASPLSLFSPPRQPLSHSQPAPATAGSSSVSPLRPSLLFSSNATPPRLPAQPPSENIASQYRFPAAPSSAKPSPTRPSTSSPHHRSITTGSIAPSPTTAATTTVQPTTPSRLIVSAVAQQIKTSPLVPPALMQFLTPTQRHELAAGKKRGFSIPGTDSEKQTAAAASAAAATSSGGKTVAFTAGAAGTVAAPAIAAEKRREVSFNVDQESGAMPQQQQQQQKLATTTSRREEIFGKFERQKESYRQNQYSRRDQIFGAPPSSSRSEGGAGASSRRDEIFGAKLEASVAQAAEPLVGGSRGDVMAPAAAVVARESGSRRTSLSFWDLRKRLLQQQVEVDEEDELEEEGIRNLSRRSSVVSSEVAASPHSVREEEEESEDDGFVTDESESDEDGDGDEYWSCSSDDGVRGGQQHPLRRPSSAGCFGGLFGTRRGSSASGRGWFGNSSSSSSTGHHTTGGDHVDEQEFVGHYVLFIGYDVATDGFIYRDPGTEEELCVMDGAAVEFARAGVAGSDHDVIVVRAGV
ncbi:hypothetical protein HDU98_001565 [Podochytrium sp. JEL0797]|nr:hypothetical protein HDU98_001565 [Podochytrium sp. JEL0797]